MKITKVRVLYLCNSRAIYQSLVKKVSEFFYYSILFLILFVNSNQLYAQLDISYTDWSIAANKYRNKTKEKLEKENLYDSLIFNSSPSQRNLSLSKYRRDKEHANFAMIGFPLNYKSDSGLWEIEYSVMGITSKPIRRNSSFQLDHGDSYNVTPYSRTYTGSNDSVYASVSFDKKYNFSKIDHDLVGKFYINEPTEKKSYQFLFAGLKHQTFSWNQRNLSPELYYFAIYMPGLPPITAASPPSFSLRDAQFMQSIGPYFGFGTSEQITEKGKITAMFGFSILKGETNSKEAYYMSTGTTTSFNAINSNEKNMIGYGFNFEISYAYEILDTIFLKLSYTNQTTSYRTFKNQKYSNINIYKYEFKDNKNNTITNYSGIYSNEKWIIYPPDSNGKIEFFPKAKTKTDYLVDIFSYLSISVSKEFE